MALLIDWQLAFFCIYYSSVHLDSILIMSKSVPLHADSGQTGRAELDHAGESGRYACDQSFDRQQLRSEKFFAPIHA
jgi:hypothetical protein